MIFPKLHKNSLFSLDQEIQSRRLIPPQSLVSAQSLSSISSDTVKNTRNSLFALEQSLQINQNPKKIDNQSGNSHYIQAFSFDDGVKIELQYRTDSFSNAASIDPFVTALTSEEQNYKVEAFNAENNVLKFDDNNEQDKEFNQVEAFEDKPSKPISSPNHFTEGSIAASVASANQPTIDIESQVIPDSETPSLSTANSATTITEDENEALAFAADIEAILRGDKTYEPTTQTTQAFSTPSAPTQPSASHPHNIFDQFEQMAHVTAFDVGIIPLEIFDEFDQRIIDEEKS